MKRVFRPIILVPIVLAVTCSVVSLPHECPSHADCRWLVKDAWGGVPLFGAFMLTAGVLAILWALRAATLYRSVRTLGHSLARAEVPCSLKLKAAMSRTGVSAIWCVAEAPQPAFCWGWMRPRITVTAAAVDLLDPSALDAVLHHEDAHRRRRDPLRRALRLAACDVIVFAPALRWWHDRASTNEELRADACARRTAGASALARALVAVSELAHPAAAAAVPFGDANAARVQQLLGETPTLTPLSMSSLVGSLAGIAMAAMVLTCLTQISI